MTSDPPLPHRPRLADHVVLRRHLVDDRELIVAHDLQTEETLELQPRELALLRCADGTRDLGGIVLAAVRQDAYRRSSELLGLLGNLQARGMLTDGIEAGEPKRELAPTRPLSALSGYRLSCDHNAACCGTYSAVPFSRAEAARACALVPDALGPDPDGPARFLPVQSSAGGSYTAVSMIDGHCPYLDERGRCRIQVAAGPEAKPLGCQLFPATFVDDGSCVRVSVSVECPCVLASVGADGGCELVPSGATCERDLWPGTPVLRLAQSLRLSADRFGTRDELHDWSASLCERGETLPDPLVALWSLADAVRDHGLDGAAAMRAIDAARAPTDADLALSLMALAGRAKAKHEAAGSWRSTSDRTRQLAAWLATGAQALLDPSRVAAALVSTDRYRSHERFYFRATLFGHHLLTEPLPLERALRDRATRVLLARQLGQLVPPECASHPAVRYPLTAVESMMRGQGLSAYVNG